jgi:hypothetical protein
MARENSIAVSDEELQKIKDARMEIFGTDEVPYGVVISTLCEDVE